MDLPLDEQFKLIAEGVKKLGGDAASQSAIIDIFGRTAGPELYTMLMEGAAGIEAMEANLDRLGLTFDSVEGNQVEAMNDAMRMITEVFYGVGRAIVIEVAPYVKSLADGFMNLIESMGGVRGIMDTVADAFKMLAKVGLYPIKILHDSWNNLKILVLTVSDMIVERVGRVAELINSLPGMIRPEWAQDVKKFADQFHGVVREANDSLAFDNQQFLDIDSWFAGIEDGSRKAAEAADATRKNFNSWGGEIDDAAEKMEKLKDVTPSGDALKGSKIAYAAISAAQREGGTKELKAIEKNGKDQIGVLRRIDRGIQNIVIPNLASANL